MARVDVEIGARTSRLKRGLDEARGMMSRWSNSLASMGAQASNRGLALMGTGVRRFTQGVGDAVKQLAALNDIAEKLGESPEVMQQMAFAAEQNGAELEGYTKALIHANQAAMDAADGNAEASSTMATLGLEADKFLQMNFAKQIVTLAQAFENLSESGDPTLRFIDLFGERAADLIILLRQGPKAVSELFGKAPMVSNKEMALLAAADDRMALEKKRLEVTRGKAAANALKLTGLIHPQEVETSAEKRKMAIRKIVKDPEAERELQKQIEDLKQKEKEVEFRSALDQEKNPQRRNYMLEGKQSELFGQARELEARGDIKGSLEHRIKAKEMAPEVFEGRQKYRDFVSGRGAHTVASSLQEIGGGGRAMTVGSGMDSQKSMASDIKNIRLTLGTLKNVHTQASSPLNGERGGFMEEQ